MKNITILTLCFVLGCCAASQVGAQERHFRTPVRTFLSEVQPVRSLARCVVEHKPVRSIAAGTVVVGARVVAKVARPVVRPVARVVRVVRHVKYNQPARSALRRLLCR